MAEMKSMGPFDLKNFPRISKVQFYFDFDIQCVNVTYAFKNKKEITSGFNNIIKENLKNLKVVEFTLQEEEYINMVKIGQRNFQVQTVQIFTSLGKEYEVTVSDDGVEYWISQPVEKNIKVLAFFGDAPNWLANIHYYYTDLDNVAQV